MNVRPSALLLLVCVAAAPAFPQQPVTADDYARAEKFLPGNLDRLVAGTVRPNWIGGTDQFWYRKTALDGPSGPPAVQFVLVNPAAGTEQPLFDHAKLAAALTSMRHVAQPVDPNHLPIGQFDVSPDLRLLFLEIGSDRYTCERVAATCTPQTGISFIREQSVSPDGQRAVFIRNWNLWLRDLTTGKEKQLTADGVENFGYATDNAGWASSDRPVVLWSPDSKKVATFQQDQRNDGDMFLVDTRLGHPVLKQWKYPLPGDAVVTTIQRVIIDVDSGRTVRLQMPPDQHRSTLCDNVACGEGPNHAPLWADVEWSPDSKSLAFVSTVRDHKEETLRVADAATGAVRDVYHETAPTEFEEGLGRVNWHYLPQSNEFLWYSERDNWGHLYLYDLAIGRLKNQITSGPWVVAQVLRVDRQTRQIWFTAQGREPGEDPYYQHLYRVDFDGSHLTPLTPQPGHHAINASPSGRWFIDSVSTPETPASTVLRDSAGKVILQLGHQDISRLTAIDWRPPVPITVKARDGKTDLYGLMFQPTHLDPAKKYPVIDSIYPGPQVGSVGSRSFSAARRDSQALAELGFIVVQLDGMGTTGRSRSYRDVSYGNLGDNTLPDQVAGLRQLAARYSFIDLTRVGIYGHSGGGFATADAMLRYPDFFQVGIAESGNHDNREYEDDWGERYQGLLKVNRDGTTNYDNQANQLLAKNLKGHLLLAHGTMDNNVPPNNTMLLIDALIHANKDFDLLLLPDQHHGYAGEANYMTRRRWDYFVRWLLNTEPPKQYKITAPIPPPPGAGGPDDSSDSQ